MKIMDDPGVTDVAPPDASGPRRKFGDVILDVKNISLRIYDARGTEVKQHEGKASSLCLQRSGSAACQAQQHHQQQQQHPIRWYFPFATAERVRFSAFTYVGEAITRRSAKCAACASPGGSRVTCRSTSSMAWAALA